MPLTQVHARFDCKHEVDLDVDIDGDVQVPDSVRGLGPCPECKGEYAIPVAGVAPQPGGRQLVLDSIMLMPV